MQPIRVIDYDPRWPSFFQAARDELLSLAPGLILAVEHIGSTAVPGLAAVRALDYLHASYRADTKHLFCKPHFAARTHHQRAPAAQHRNACTTAKVQFITQMVSEALGDPAA